jgi:flagellar motor switch/type III secretory pathway protein FliN
MEPPSDIDALLDEAESLAAQAATEVGAELDAPDKTERKERNTPASRSRGALPEAVQRVLQIKVPIIVRLAQRKMPVSQVLDFAPGKIIDFERDADSHLDLMTNNRCIGRGTPVKVGENFGLRVTSITGARGVLRAIRDG